VRGLGRLFIGSQIKGSSCSTVGVESTTHVVIVIIIWLAVGLRAIVQRLLNVSVEEGQVSIHVNVFRRSIHRKDLRKELWAGSQDVLELQAPNLQVAIRTLGVPIDQVRRLARAGTQLRHQLEDTLQHVFASGHTQARLVGQITELMKEIINRCDSR
jgi:hypothetical protein